MNKKLKIVVYNANYYGIMAASQRIRNLFDPLASYKNVIISNMVLNSKYLPKQDVNQKIRFKNITYNYKNPFSIIFYFIETFRYLKSQKCKVETNIFYCYDYPSIENIFILLIAKLLKYKIAFDIVEDLVLIPNLKSKSNKMKLYLFSVNKMQKLIPVLGNACFCISHHLVKKISFFSKGRIPVFYLPISTKIYEIQSYISKKSNDGSIIIFYGGSFGAKDGLIYLIKGFEIACNKIKNIKLVLTGKGNIHDEDNIKHLISASSYKDRIINLGCLSSEDYFKTMSNSDILCMVRENTAYANAGFPFKLGEYLSSGKAVIATDVGDIQNYLENNKNALIIEPENPLEISNAIIRLCLDPVFRNKLGNEGLQVAKKYFDAKIVSQKLYNYLIQF